MGVRGDEENTPFLTRSYYDHVKNKAIFTISLLYVYLAAIKRTHLWPRFVCNLSLRQVLNFPIYSQPYVYVRLKDDFFLFGGPIYSQNTRVRRHDENYTSYIYESVANSFKLAYKPPLRRYHRFGLFSNVSLSPTQLCLVARFWTAVPFSLRLKPQRVRSIPYNLLFRSISLSDNSRDSVSAQSAH